MSEKTVDFEDLSRIRESDVEDYLKERVHAHGGEVRKLQWIGRRGAPDRLVMLEGPHFIEMKRPGEVPEPHQDREHGRMRKHGLQVWVLDSYDAVDIFIWGVTRCE